MTKIRPAFVLVGLLALSGCGAAAAPRPVAPAPTEAAPVKTTEVPETVISPYTDDELVKQFEHGRELVLAGKIEEAAKVFDKLSRLAPKTLIGASSLYNAGMCHEDLGEHDVAIERYTALVTAFPEHQSARPARFRAMHLLGYVERWPELLTMADSVLKLTDLTVIEKIDALGARALGNVEQDKLDEADKDVMRARDIIEDNHLGESGKPPMELMQVSFALGEVRRLKSEKIGFDPLPPNFPVVLEARCQALLDAQAAYTDAMRGYDAHWSAMSGYRIGQLYQKLHAEVMAIPPTAAAKTLKQKQLFEATMRLRYRILLEKGLKMMDGTVRLGERTGETSGWVSRARDAKKDLEQALADEKAALSKMPFSEDEVKEAMEKLKQKASAQPAATSQSGTTPPSGATP